MQWPLSLLVVSGALSVFPAHAQVTNVQVGTLVEALRRSAPQTKIKNDGLYSAWQVLPANIPRWSKQCIGRELSPAQFEASPGTARSILVCTMRDVLRDEYRASGNSETVAVRRAAAWWMTGNPNRYTDGRTAFYTQKVLNFYQELRPKSVAKSAQSTPKPSYYDRYMQAGYAATSQKDYQTALINFRKALGERPGDRYATQAISNTEVYIQGTRAAASSPSPSSSASSSSSPVPNQSQSSASASTITQEQTVKLVIQWLQVKQRIFAPPFDRQPIVDLTTGELYTDLDRSDGPIAWLKNNNAYYRFGVQKVESVERFVTSGNKATIELRVTEDRTLYRNGKVDPSQTDFETRLLRYSLQSSAEGTWKITDYKTADGLALERAVAQ